MEFSATGIFGLLCFVLCLYGIASIFIDFVNLF